MNIFRTYFPFFILIFGLLFVSAPAQQKIPVETAKRDGQRDFDFEIGKWKTHLKRRLRPLTGSNEWVEYEGTSAVSKVWNGDANMAELDVNGPVERREGGSLRTIDTEAL